MHEANVYIFSELYKHVGTHFRPVYWGQSVQSGMKAVSPTGKQLVVNVSVGVRSGFKVKQ